eukprot:TRINITY_DN668_c0_g1_i1.p1 TRINITY_DN668_c0_g1~~TRINITY_DN668_c0_g1_i1.p1  ORF type:complete len:216 (-),score=40.69 TRINITY_DN668_c0_g1_i1:303-950(-)
MVIASYLKSSFHPINIIASYLKSSFHPINRLPCRSSFYSAIPRLMNLRYTTGTSPANEEPVSEESKEGSPNAQVLQPHGVDPRKGWNFRGVHKAIICGKVGQTPVQKILRNGRAVTIFTVGTGGLHDQRFKSVPYREWQWHRISVHNEKLGAYAVKRLLKGSPVYVEGDIEMRVYNDAIDGQVRSIPEICVRQNGRVCMIDDGVSNDTLNEVTLD